MKFPSRRFINGDPISLLPDRINIKELENFAMEQIEFGKKMLSMFNTS